MFTTKTRLALPIISTAAFALAVACGDSAGDASPPKDGDDSGVGGDASPRSDGGGPDDGGPPDARADADAEADPDGGDGIPSKLLAAGDVILHGVTTDNHAVFTRKTAQGQALESVNLADGTVAPIWPALPQQASVVVSGNAVAIWTNIDVITGLGTVAYWTPTTTARLNVAQLSVRDAFWATADGSRVAFFANAETELDTLTSAELVVATTADGARTTVLADDERVAFDFDSCGSSIGFGGQTLIVAYCPPGSASAKLVTIADVANPTRKVLVDEGLQPFWSASATGDKIFVIAEDHTEGRLITDDGTEPAPSAPIEPDTNEGFVMKDGSAIVYRTGTTLRRAPIDNGAVQTPVTVATGDARKILDVTADQSALLYHSLPGRPVDPQNPDGERWVDLQTIATSATNAAPVALVATERAISLGFSGNAAHALFFANGPKLVSTARDGSGERSMSVDFTNMDVTPTSSGAVLSVNARQFGDTSVVDLVHVDFTTGGGTSPAIRPVTTDVASSGTRFAKAPSKTLVFVRRAATGSGLYSVVLP